MSEFIQKLFTSYKTRTDGDTRIGQLNRIWYDSETNTFRIQLDNTPGGTIIGGGGTGGGDYTLPTASSTVKGGVKIDGTTITINNQVISGFSGSYTDLTNKPTIPAAQVNSDWNASSGLAQILNKPALFSGSYTDLTNKPTIPAAQIQSDWTQSNNASLDFIKNKPTIPDIGPIQEVFSATTEPMGHADKSQSTISFNDSTRTFTISPVSTSYNVWVKGVKFVISTTRTVTIPNTTGLYYIYFDAAGALQYQTSFFDWPNQAPTAYVYWNSGTGKAPMVADERHGIVLDWQTHEYLHRTRGAAIANGFGATNYILGGNGSLNTHIQLDIASGTFFDEDLEVNVVSTNTPTANTWEQDLTGPSQIPIFYLSGTTGWVRDNPTTFPLKRGSVRPVYNLNTAGTWSTPDIDNNKFGATFIIATNNINYPVMGVISQTQHANQSDAEALEWNDLNLTGFPIVEFRPLYKVVYQTKTNYSNTSKATIVSLWDLRSFDSVISSAASFVDANALSGTVLAPSVVTSSLTSLGTLTNLTFADNTTQTTAYPGPPDLSNYATLDGEQTLTNKTLTSPTITDGVFQTSFTIGNQVFYDHGYNGFSVNENFDIVGESNFTGYHYTSGAGRDGVAFTLARTGQFTDGFGITGDAQNNQFVIGGEAGNTDFLFKTGIGMPFNVSGGTTIFKIGRDGHLTFADATVQETAWTGTLDQILWINPTPAPGDPFRTAISAASGNASISLTSGLPNLGSTVSWTFDTTKITFPDTTTQTTAWTGSIAYASVTGTPTLATVATSGSYADLSNKPTIPTTVTVNGTSITLGSSGTVTAAAGTLTGTELKSTVVTSSLTSVGTLTGLTTSGAVSITYTPGSTTGYALTTTGKDTQGGTGYFDFFKATNTTSGVSNGTKSFRITSVGTLEVLNSAYTAVLASLDNSGNLVTAGTVRSAQWVAGQIIKDTMLSNTEFTVNTTTVATSNSDTDFITYSYTPTSSSSYLIIHVHVGAYSALEATGGGTDSYFSRIKVDSAEITYSRQYTRSGDSFRTGSLFPLTGRYTNSNTNAKTITVGVRRDSADDNISIVNSSTALWMRITEIAR